MEICFESMEVLVLAFGPSSVRTYAICFTFVRIFSKKAKIFRPETYRISLFSYDPPADNIIAHKFQIIEAQINKFLFLVPANPFMADNFAFDLIWHVAAFRVEIWSD